MKTKSSHTPGPFLTMGSFYVGRAYRIQKGGKVPCDCYLWDDDDGPGGKGNGVQFFMCSLHSTAPDLLAALKAALSVLYAAEGRGGIEAKSEISQARAAIALAEGQKAEEKQDA